MAVTEIVVCTTCRGPGRVDGVGAALAAALVISAAGSEIAILPVACLWSCERGASAQLRHPDKIGYVMGGFATSDAGALVDFARAYAASDDGAIPYNTWPDGILGHFIARTPPPEGMLA